MHIINKWSQCCLYIEQWVVKFRCVTNSLRKPFRWRNEFTGREICVWNANSLTFFLFLAAKSYYTKVNALQTTPGSFLLLPVGLHLRPTHSPCKTQHQTNLPLRRIFNKFIVFSQKLISVWNIALLELEILESDNIMLIPISLIHLFFIAELFFHAQKEDNYMIWFVFALLWYSIVLGLHERTHTVAINNKTSILLSLGCVKDKIEYACIQ